MQNKINTRLKKWEAKGCGTIIEMFRPIPPREYIYVGAVRPKVRGQHEVLGAAVAVLCQPGLVDHGAQLPLGPPGKQGS